MADSDLKINVVTTADTSGIDDVAGAMKNFEDVAKRTGETVSQVQARFAEGPKFVQAITTEAEKTTQAFQLTRSEVAALSNELIRGNLNARSLGTILSGFGTPIAAAGIAMFTIVELILKAEEEQDKWTAGVLKTTEEMRKLGESILEAQDALRMSALIGALPLGAGLNLARQEVERLKTEQSLVNLETKEGLEEYKKYTGEIQKAQAVVDSITKKQEHQTDVVKATTDQIAINRATGDEELTIQLKVAKVYDDKLKALREAQVPEALAKDLASETAESERNRLEAIRGQAPAQRDFNAALKEAQATLQVIRLQQTLTQGASFLGVDAKDAALLGQYKSELQQVTQQITAIQAQKSGGALDPATLARDNTEMIKLLGTAGQLQQKISAGQKSLQSELQTWANSFGSTMTQVGHTLEQTVGVALQSFNQWIVTGKFNLQQLLQQIAQLGLQLVEQLIEQRIVAMINARAAEAEAVASSKIIAAAWASAATAVTIATEGEAAYSAPVAVAIALGGVQAALGLGTLHEGGPVTRRMHSGGLAHDEVPIIAQEGEIMIQRSVAQQPGMSEFLLGLNSGMFHDGGRIRRMHGGGDRFNYDDFLAQFSDHSFTEPPILSPPDFGPPSTTASGGDFSGFAPGDFGFSFNQAFQPGYFGSPGSGWFNQGPTMIPTTVGSSGFPMAVSLIAPDYTPSIGIGGLPGKKQSHSGGLISRFHSGGAVGKSGGGGGGVHIYAFTDLKQLTRHMSSREGQKIIFDTVKGRRIDLGI